MSAFELAQLNIARLIEPIDSPRLADFVANLDRINKLAESSPGYVWRLQDEDGNATALRPFGDDTIVNMSTWRSIEALHHYVYRTAHVEVMRRRKEWFEHMRQAYAVLWWVPQGHLPSLEEAKGRLLLLQESGPGPQAFTFKKPYTAAQQHSAEPSPAFENLCPAQ